MKPKEWNEGLDQIDLDIVEEYISLRDTYTEKKTKKRIYWIATAALLTLVIALATALGGTTPNALLDFIWTTTLQLDHTRPTGPLPPSTYPTLPKPGGIAHPENWQFENLVSTPIYPQMAPYAIRENFSDWQAYKVAEQAWRDSKKVQYNQPDGYADSLTHFFKVSIAQFLQNDGNAAYSPINVYMAMAMLAETAGGSSRQQILDLLGVKSIEELRTQASHVWNAHYCDDKQTALLMANSLWLDSQYSYHQKATDILAQYYYASTFHGDLGTEPLNQQLREWIDANTGGLLKEQSDNAEMDPRTVFALASTVYFSAEWVDEFYEENTWDETFHSPAGDTTANFMHKSDRDTYYRGTHFGAIRLYLKDNSKMWLILPDEGYTAEDIVKSDEYLRLTLDPINWPNQKYCIIHLSLPKFDVVQQQDLISGMKRLGITDVFNSDISDFSPITNTPNLFVSQINHTARVAIDEKGCTAAAFTFIAIAGEGPPDKIEEINFTLDRPFLFLVTSHDHLPLFAGVVNEP